MIKAKELRQKQENELNALLKKKRSELLDFKFKLAKGKTKNVKEGKNIRKEIARILTVLSDLSVR